MHEERDLVVGAYGAWIAHNQPTEKTTIDVASDATHVVMKCPGTDRLLRCLKHIGPALPRLDLVTAPSVVGSQAERPCTVGVDAIAQPVQMKAVAIAGIGVADMNVQSLARLRVQDGAGNAAVPRRLIAIGSNNRGGVRNCVVRVEIFAVDQSIQRCCQDLARREPTIFVTRAKHTIASIPARTGNWSERTVGWHCLDLQKDVTIHPGTLPSRETPFACA